MHAKAGEGSAPQWFHTRPHYWPRSTPLPWSAAFALPPPNVARDLGWCDHETIEALVGFCSPILLRPGFFLCTLDYEPAKPVHKKHNTRRYGQYSLWGTWSYRGGAKRFFSTGYLMGQGLIHVLGSLCTTTRCSPFPRRLSGLRSHPQDSQMTFYAQSCK
jgi:hypothetical protein